ncbi:MAG TPA: hypothetical protein VHG72_21400 [Polyangia bacterium]|nr:hypothetical protein [Polyangia bacterium]
MGGIRGRAQRAIGAALLAALAGAGCAGQGFRQIDLSAPVGSAAGTLSVAVDRVLLDEQTVDSGMTGDTALVVELAVHNAGARPFVLKPSALWCLMQLDAEKPGETRLLPPSVSGDGAFHGAPAERTELAPIEVAPGQTRSFWVLFSGYRFPNSDVPRRITLAFQDPTGRTLEVVLADPARGTLRWNVATQPTAWMFGVQNIALYGGYTRGNLVGTRLAHVAQRGRFLWDFGISSQLFILMRGQLSAPLFSLAGTGFDAHLAAPLLAWGEPQTPSRLGPYAGLNGSVLIANEATALENAQGMPIAPPVYGMLAPEIGVELDVGALHVAGTPFPLTSTTRNPLPRWTARLGYLHTWIGHGTADGYTSSLCLVW